MFETMPGVCFYCRGSIIATLDAWRVILKPGIEHAVCPECGKAGALFMLEQAMTSENWADLDKLIAKILDQLEKPIAALQEARDAFRAGNYAHGMGKIGEAKYYVGALIDANAQLTRQTEPME